MTLSKSTLFPGKGRLLGYARVSTEDQATDAQTDELRAAGCATIYQEHGSGASRARPEQDPGVAQGLYCFDVMTWRTAPGTVTAPAAAWARG